MIHGEVVCVSDSPCLSPIKPRDRLGDVVDGPMKSGSAKRREQEGTPAVIGRYVLCLQLLCVPRYMYLFFAME